MKVEITAPVGSFESLLAALNSHADSVYFGIGNLNMRSASAVNFSPGDLPKIVRLCRENGARAYLALNTVIFDHERPQVSEMIEQALHAGIDAVIASDISVVLAAATAGIPVHMSTQTNITNLAAVKFFSQWADVMVLSRELSLSQIADIHKGIVRDNITGPSGGQVRLEAFAHGALCMAVSGKCYLSLDNLNSSANRGACTQICRRPYRVTDLEGGVELVIDNQYIMSPSDLCTIGFLDKLIDAGVSVLKIEGRGRPPEYVSTTVRVYRQALDAIFNHGYNESLIEQLEMELSQVYNRGFWGGYYLGKPLGEWSLKHGSSATVRREFIGRITNYFSRLGVAEARAETSDVFPGDRINITGPTTGLYEGEIEELHLDQGEAEFAPKGSLFSFKTKRLVRRGDMVYRMVKA